MNDFISELKRRNVVRVGIAYAIVGWVALQFVDVVQDPLSLPEWFQKAVIVLLTIGFPIALILSWAYEVTPEGVKKTKEVDKSKSVTHSTGQKINKLIGAGFVLALGFIIYQNFISSPGATFKQAEAGSASIAVLPFTNMSGLPENEQFTNGLHDDLLTQLSKIESLKVISRTSVLDYRGTTKSMTEIGRELGVATLIEGGIQRAGNRVRINIQLIDASTDQHIWAETYDRELTVANIFDVQTEIARSITDQLNATFNPEEVARISEVPTENLEAYEAYLEGMTLINEIVANYENAQRAEAALKKAIELDTNFAQAWAGLSLTYMNYYWWSDRLEERRYLPMAKEAADKALEMKPGLPEGHEALGVYYYWGLLEYEKSIEEFNKAIEGGVRTTNVYSMRGSAYRRSGKYWEEALPDFEKSVDLDPRDPSAHWALAGMYQMIHRYKDSIYHYEKAIDLDPDSYNYYSSLAVMYFSYLNDPSKLPLLEQSPTFSYDLNIAAAYPYYMILSGDPQKALDFLEKAEELKPLKEYGRVWQVRVPALKAWAYKAVGEAQRSEKFLNKALTEANGLLAENPDFFGARDLKVSLLLDLGRLEEGLDLARETRRVKTQEDDAVDNLSYEITLIQALAANNQLDEAIERLDAYLSYPNASALGYVLRLPYMRNIQLHPEFPALVDKYGLAFDDKSLGVGQ